MRATGREPRRTDWRSPVPPLTSSPRSARPRSNSENSTARFPRRRTGPSERAPEASQKGPRREQVADHRDEPTTNLCDAPFWLKGAVASTIAGEVSMLTRDTLCGLTCCERVNPHNVTSLLGLLLWTRRSGAVVPKRGGLRRGGQRSAVHRELGPPSRLRDPRRRRPAQFRPKARPSGRCTGGGAAPPK